MNLSNKNIDKLFRDAAQNAAPTAYSSTFWNEIETQLNADENKKRTLIYWFFSGAIVSTFLVALLFINLDKSSVYNAKNLDLKIEDSNIENQTSLNFLENKKRNTNSKENTNKPILASKITQQNSLTSSVNERKDSFKSEINSISKTENSTQIIRTENKTKKLRKLDNTQVSSLPILKPIIKSGLISPYKSNLSPNHFFVQLNAGLNQKVNQNNAGFSAKLDAALGYEINAHNISVKLGLGVGLTTNDGSLFKRSSRVYGFGSTDYLNRIRYKNLYEANIPLEIAYNFKPFKVGLGAKVNYLLHTSSRFESSIAEIATESIELKGIEKGLNKFSLDSYVFAEKRILKNTHIGLKVGLNSLSRYNKYSGFENLNTNNNPVFGQFYIRHNITH